MTVVKQIPAAEVQQRVEPVSGDKLNLDPVSKVADPILVEALEKEFDKMVTEERDTKYQVKLTKSKAEDILELVKISKWKGLEAFAVQKCVDEIAPQLEAMKDLDADGEATLAVSGPTLNAVSHYLTSFEGASYEDAVTIVGLAEVVAPAMETLQANRKALQDSALTLDAARKGMTADELRTAYEKGMQG